MYLKFVHLRASHLLNVPRDYISMLSPHKTGSLKKPDLLNIMCTFTNIQEIYFAETWCSKATLIKYTFYPVVQTHVKFLSTKVTRQGFAFSCIAAVYFPFLQKLSSGFALGHSHLPVLTQLWNIWQWMLMSSLMGSPALAVWKQCYPFR